MSDEKPAREDDPRAASDAELSDEQLDREAPGVEDADELEAAEADLAAEAETDEDKVVAGRAAGSRRRGRERGTPGRRRERFDAERRRRRRRDEPLGA